LLLTFFYFNQIIAISCHLLYDIYIYTHSLPPVDTLQTKKV
jgi:hypothetical protein